MEDLRDILSSEYVSIEELAELIACHEGGYIDDGYSALARYESDEPGWRDLTLYRRDFVVGSGGQWNALPPSDRDVWKLATACSSATNKHEAREAVHKGECVFSTTYVRTDAVLPLLHAGGYLLKSPDETSEAWFEMFGLLQHHRHRANNAIKAIKEAEIENGKHLAASVSAEHHYDETKRLKAEIEALRKQVDQYKDAAVDAKFYKDQREVVIKDLHAARDENARLVGEREAAITSEASSRHTTMVLQQQIDLMTKNGAQPKPPAPQMTNSQDEFIALLARAATDTPFDIHQLGNSADGLIDLISENYPGDDIPIPIRKTVFKYLKNGVKRLSENNASNKEFIDWLTG